MARSKAGVPTGGSIPLIHSPLEYHPEHVRAIGMISIELANMDYMLGGLVACLLHIDEDIGRTLYLTPRVAIGRLEIFENTISASVRPNTDRDKQLRDLLAKARSIVQKRHGMIHDFGVSTLKQDNHPVSQSPLSKQNQGNWFQ